MVKARRQRQWLLTATAVTSAASLVACMDQTLGCSGSYVCSEPEGAPCYTTGNDAGHEHDAASDGPPTEAAADSGTGFDADGGADAETGPGADTGSDAHDASTMGDAGGDGASSVDAGAD
jgi:hypothetical protein